MTDEQKDLVCRIKLSLLRAIVNFDEQTMWDCIEKVLKEETERGGEDAT